MQSQSTLYFEQILEKIKHDGWYQKRTTFLMGCQFIIATIVMVTPPYLFQVPQFICQNDVVCYENTGACDGNVKISKDSIFSISKEFELYCERTDYRDMGESILYLGAIVGILIFTQLADIKGRRYTLRITWALFSIGSIVSVLTKNMSIIFSGLFLMGMGVFPAITVDIIYLNEISYGSFRQTSVIILYIMWGVSEMLILPLSLIFERWDSFIIAGVVLPSLALNIVGFQISESPKFLMNGNIEEAANSLKFIQKINKTQDQLLISPQMIDTSEQQQQTQLKCSYYATLKYQSQRRNIFLILFSIFIHLLYYGTNFILARSGLDFHWNIFYIGISETLGSCVSERISHKLKRKNGIIISIVVTVILLQVTNLFIIPQSCMKPHKQCWQKDGQLFTIALTRFCLSIAFSLMVLWANELYPTPVRSAGNGLMFGIGMIGGFLSPIVVDYSYEMGVSPIIVISMMCLFSVVFLIYLKETQGSEPPDQIPELRQDQITEQQFKYFEKGTIKFGPQVQKQKGQKQQQQYQEDDEFKQIPIDKKL